jgi:hypothetical protein
MEIVALALGLGLGIPTILAMFLASQRNHCHHHVHPDYTDLERRVARNEADISNLSAQGQRHERTLIDHQGRIRALRYSIRSIRATFERSASLLWTIVGALIGAIWVAIGHAFVDSGTVTISDGFKKAVSLGSTWDEWWVVTTHIAFGATFGAAVAIMITVYLRRRPVTP